MRLLMPCQLYIVLLKTAVLTNNAENYIKVTKKGPMKPVEGLTVKPWLCGWWASPRGGTRRSMGFAADEHRHRRCRPVLPLWLQMGCYNQNLFTSLTDQECQRTKLWARQRPNNIGCATKITKHKKNALVSWLRNSLSSLLTTSFFLPRSSLQKKEKYLEFLRTSYYKISFKKNSCCFTSPNIKYLQSSKYNWFIWILTISQSR